MKKRNEIIILVALVKPRWVDGRAFGRFQPIFDAVVAGKNGSLWWLVSKRDGSRPWEFECGS